MVQKEVEEGQTDDLQDEEAEDESGEEELEYDEEEQEEVSIVLPPKNLHWHCFRSLLGHLHVPGEIANNDYAKSFFFFFFGGGGGKGGGGGVKEVYCGI